MEVKGRLKNFSELSEGISALGESIRAAEKDMASTWMDQIEKRDLQDLKNYVKEVENLLCILQEEVSHI